MILFCVFWIPLLYILWRLFRPAASIGRFWSFWALLLGACVALFQYFTGNLIDGGGFGDARFYSTLLDVLGIPAVLPLLVWGCIAGLKKLFHRPGVMEPDLCSFTLLWLIPSGLYRAVFWSSARFPLYLVLVPLLWSALALGMPFCLRVCVKHPAKHPSRPGNKATLIGMRIAAGLGCIALPFIAAAAWKAFFGMETFKGILFLFLSLIPAVLSFLFQEKTTLQGDSINGNFDTTEGSLQL
jgi:hypothetical protein